MKVFRTMTIHGPKSALVDVMEEIRNSLQEGWARSAIDEDRVNGRVGAGNFYCFSCTANDEHPAATIFLVHGDDSEIHVANIIPKSNGALSYDEYNSILEEFFIAFVEPCSKKFHVEVALSESERTLEHWLPQHTANLLRKFSKSADKSSGPFLHPRDKPKWLAFLIAVHEVKNEFTPELLSRWLREEGWDKELAGELAYEYEFANDLLEYADGVKVGN